VPNVHGGSNQRRFMPGGKERNRYRNRDASLGLAQRQVRAAQLASVQPQLCELQWSSTEHALIGWITCGSHSARIDCELGAIPTDPDTAGCSR
jgi:hypothetical protein